MFICVNEYSLHNQFKDYNHFAESAINIIFPCLEFARIKQFSFLVSEDLLERNVFDNKSVIDVLCERGDAVSYKIKGYIQNFLQDSGFWASEPKTQKGVNYICPYDEVIPNSITEAAEGDHFVYSFPYSNYRESAYSIQRGENAIIVYNFSSINTFYDVLFRDGKIKALEFISLQSEQKFELCGTRIENYLNNDKRITYKEGKVILEDLYKMIADIGNSVQGSRYYRDLQVRGTRFWEFKTTLSFGEFRMFYIHHNNKFIFFDVAEKHEQKQRINVAPTTISNLKLD